jgi:UDP:flavonoid glycosyltransferase YjiC (YdhE family)
MASPTVAFFAMPEDGHVRRLLPLVSAVASRARAVVWTHARFHPAVARCGAEARDLFAGRPVEAVDDESMPVPCRFVTFAGVHAGAVAEEVARDRPSLVVHDSFAVVGRAVAARLRLPSVHACAGHAVDAAAFRAALDHDPRVRVSDRCRAAADVLRDRFGLEDASPFAYVAPRSPLLNVCGEPPEWLDDSERARLEPVAFFGCLPGEPAAPARRTAATPRAVRVYASFGTVVWRYYASEARAALVALAQAVAGREGALATIALGGAGDEDTAKAVARAGGDRVRVVDYADQQAALAAADLFLTHHGLNATHEAVWQGVPMLSYPFFWDQPALARRAQEMGVALPLGDGRPRAPVTAREVSLAVDAAVGGRREVASRLALARSHEERVIGGRPAVVERLLAASGASAGSG